MTEPQTPSPAWDALPVLTEVVETPFAEPTAELPVQADVPVLVDFDIPDFDFSAEMAQLSEALPDTDLDFPAELTLDEVLSAGDRGGESELDAEALIGRLPSLDLNVPLPDDMDLGEVLPGFAMPEGALNEAPSRASDAGEVGAPISGSFAEALPAASGVSDEPLGQAAVVVSVAEIPVLVEPLVMPEIAGREDGGLSGGEPVSGDVLLSGCADDLAEDADGSLGVSSAFDVPALHESTALLDGAKTGGAGAGNLTDMPDPVPVVGIDDVGCVQSAVELVEAAPDWASADGVAPADVLYESLALEAVVAEPVLSPLEHDDAFVSGDVSTPLEEFAFDLGAAAGVPPVGVAASYAASLSEKLSDGAPSTPRAYAIGQSISLDSLPTGVLGGGLGPAAVAHDDQGVDAETDREVELGWARDLGVELPSELKRHFSRPLTEAVASVAEPPVAAAAVLPDSVSEVCSDVVDAPSPVDELPDVGQPAVESVMQLSAVRAVSPPLAVVAGVADSVPSVSPDALVEALYARVLPRMKVELALWMQDALEVQAKQLMSGVMQHLKEDFDMMLAEALRESLREAIDEAQSVSGES